MKILGIKYGGHDTSAALMIDGNWWQLVLKKDTQKISTAESFRLSNQ